jgi:hypothetical protein
MAKGSKARASAEKRKPNILVTEEAMLFTQVLEALPQPASGSN